MGFSPQRGARAILIGLAAAAALPVAAAPAAKPPKAPPGGGQGSNLSIAATSPLTWGRSTTVTGKLTGSGNSGVAVDLEADPYPFDDAGFTKVANAATDANGDYRFTAKPTSHTRYRAVAKASPPETSAAATVLVRVRVTFALSDRTPRAGQRVRFSGTVCPDHDGKLAYIQRRTSTGSYATVTRVTLTDTGGTCSAYAKRLRVKRNGVYRVKVPSGDADHSTGTSRRVSADVHG